MSSFTQAQWHKLATRNAKGSALYQVLAPGFDWEIGFLGSGLCLHVPGGFITDLVSLPGVLHMLRYMLPDSWWNRMTRSAIVHDLVREDQRFTKEEGDAMFLMCMNAEGTPAPLREVAFLAVRLNNTRDPMQPGLYTSSDG